MDEEQKEKKAEEEAENEKEKAVPQKKEEPAAEARQKYKGKDAYFMIAVVVVLLCISAFFAVQHFHKPAPKYDIVTYNGFKFVRMSDLWYFNWQTDGEMYVASLQFNPYEVEDVPIYGQTDERFNQQRIYITHDPAESGLSWVVMATTELTANLVTTQNIEIEAACSENKTTACWDRPIITCGNTNASVIYLKEADEARVDLLGNCMVIQGRDKELVRAAEKILYIWYNIII